MMDDEEISKVLHRVLSAAHRLRNIAGLEGGVERMVPPIQGSVRTR